jgi:hypothetical protein
MGESCNIAKFVNVNLSNWNRNRGWFSVSLTTSNPCKKRVSAPLQEGQDKGMFHLSYLIELEHSPFSRQLLFYF